MSTPGIGWDELLKQYVQEQAGAGRATSTLETQARRLRSLPAALGVDPLHATTDQVSSYFSQLDAAEIPPATVKAQRLAVRSLYRWFAASGRRSGDPSAIAPRGSTIPTVWVHALEAFAVDQRARQLTPSTVDQRLKYVRRFAARCSLDPWSVTHADVHGWLEQLTVTHSSRLSHRSALRAFYRWAYTTQRVFIDPMELTYAGPPQWALPSAWVGVLREYRSHLRTGGRAETTIDSFLEALRHFARQNAHLGPFDVTIDDLAAWMGNKRWARETRRRYRQTLVGFYRWAQQTGRALHNPAEALPVVRARPPHPRPAEDDEYQSALAGAGDRETLALRLAAELGLRRFEVAGLHSRNIQGPHGARELVVLGKGDKFRRIPVPDGLASVLLARPAGYLFPGRDNGHLSPRWLGRQISSLLPAGVTMHQLRHRFATRAYSIDRDTFAVQQLLGHASPATTQRYVRVSTTDLRRLVEGAA